MMYVTFQASVKGGELGITMPDEIKDIAWMDLEQADQRMPYYEDGLSAIVKRNQSVPYLYEGRF